MFTFIVMALITKRLLIRTYCCILDDSTIRITAYCLIVVRLGWYLAIYYFFFDSVHSLKRCFLIIFCTYLIVA